MVRLNRSNSRTIDTFFILALLALFAITSFLVIVIGARQYHSIADRMTENYETRTAASYLVEKFHQHDVSGSVSIVDLDGTPAISLSQIVNERSYFTYIRSKNHRSLVTYHYSLCRQFILFYFDRHLRPYQPDLYFTECKIIRERHFLYYE